MIARSVVAVLFGAALCLTSGSAVQAQNNLLEQLRRQPEQRPAPQPPASPPALDTLKRPIAPGAPSKSGPQARAATPRGPDLLGVRLGMTMGEAEALIRRAMNVNRVLDTPDPSPTQATALALRLQGRLFMTEDGQDQIAIFQGREAAADRVLGVWRKTNGGTDSYDKTLAALVLRHGPTASRPAYEGYWGASSSMAIAGAALRKWPVWRERDKSVPINQSDRYVQQVPELPLPNPLTLAGYEPCDALLVARHGATPGESGSSEVVTRLSRYGRSGLAGFSPTAGAGNAHTGRAYGRRATWFRHTGDPARHDHARRRRVNTRSYAGRTGIRGVSPGERV